MGGVPSIASPCAMADHSVVYMGLEGVDGRCFQCKVSRGETVKNLEGLSSVEIERRSFTNVNVKG